MKYMIETWGCQMNAHDSEVLAGLLEQMGYLATENENDADVVLLNTCCIREKAENKVFGRLGNLKKLKANNPELILGVCGCMVQRPEMADKIKKRMPHMDLIFGTHNIHQLPDLITEAKQNSTARVKVWDREGKIVEDLPMRRAAGIKAFVNIMYGCNNFCTYCIVPHVRGRERSRHVADIITEIEHLVQQGYVEVMLLGQNVNSYGKDLDNNIDFAGLLKKVNDILGLQRIRFMTSHPRDFTDKLIDSLANCGKVCEHYHLPIQAGSTAILKRMNRGYTKGEYLDLVKQIRQKVPNASITTDIIVGFPGETDADFEDTMDILQRVQFDGAYTFIYSPRPGTPAADMAEQVPPDQKKERFQRLLKLQNSITEEKHLQLLRSTQEVLFEGTSKNDEHIMSGRTRSNKLVHVPADKSVIGKFYLVNITKAQMFSVSGELLEEI